MTEQQQNRNLLLAAALESGEFKQCEGVLSRVCNSGYCCLGVACELFRRDTGEGEWKQTEFCSGALFLLDAESNEHLPPERVAEYYGWVAQYKGKEIVARDPIIEVCDVEKSAAEHNDAGASFKEIAEAFRELAQGGVCDVRVPVP